MAKKYKLTHSLSYDYSIIGITSQLKDFKLCLFLNEAMDLALTREGQFPANDADDATQVGFPFFRYHDPNQKTNWYLIANRNHLTQLMLPELKQIDFLLIADRMPEFISIKDCLGRINKITNVQFAQELTVNKLKGLGSILQELEMYLLELDLKKKHPR